MMALNNVYLEHCRAREDQPGKGHWNEQEAASHRKIERRCTCGEEGKERRRKRRQKASCVSDFCYLDGAHHCMDYFEHTLCHFCHFVFFSEA